MRFGRISLVQKKFKKGKKIKIFVKSILVQTFLLANKILEQKQFCSINEVGPKTFDPKKYWSKDNIGAR